MKNRLIHLSQMLLGGLVAVALSTGLAHAAKSANCTITTVPMPAVITAGGSIDFNGTVSGKAPRSYDWTFTGGSPSQSTQQNVTVSYAGQGSYTATLDGENDKNATCSASVPVTVNPPAGNVPPTANAGGPYNGTAGEAVVFDGSGSTDTDGTITAYDWTFGDGGTGSGISPSHTYATAAVYNVSLTVTDNDGDSDSDSTTASIIAGGGNVAPTLNPIGNKSVVAGEDLSFTVTATDDGLPTTGTLTLSASNLPSGASFTDNGGGNGTFEWLNASPTGSTNTTFTADDGSLTDEETITITVNAVGAAVSINSTSQSCGSADVSGNGIVCNDTPVAEQPFTGNNAGHAIVAINDLGMHCGDLDTRISSILPPFQVLLAQVIQKGSQPQILSPNQADVFYSAVSNPGDPILGMNPDTVFRGLTADGSIYKTNFWDYPIPGGTYDAFYPAFNPFTGDSLTPLAGPPFNITYDVGLPVPNLENFYFNGSLTAVTQNMPGILNPYVANAPQEIHEHISDKPFFTSFPFGYVANDVNWFEAAGPPFSAYDDAGRENAYPLVRVEGRSAGGTPLASVDTVLPISGEASCKNCHADPMDPNFGGSRTGGPTDALLLAGLPVVDSSTDPLLVAGNVPIDVAVEWATDINVLRLHDTKHGAKYADFCDGSVSPCPTDPCIISDTNPNGSASCLTNQALVQIKPVVCQVCHYTPALDLAQLGPLAGEPGTVPNGRNQVAHQSNSRVMHNHHGQFASLFPPLDPPVQDGSGGISNQSARVAQIEETCYQCHPGTNVQCLRGAMFDGGMLCNDCHGDMLQVGADFTQGVSPQTPGAFKLGLGNYYDPANTDQPRVPWANEPGCGSCHTGDALDNAQNDGTVASNEVIVNVADSNGNADGIRLRQAWRIGDPVAKPIVPNNTRFAENSIPADFNGTPNPGAGTSSTGAANPKLYRVSTGHGGVFCEGCHGATHAEFDSDAPSLTNDDVASVQLQGHVGTITECNVCHTDAAVPLGLDGPHGMHPVVNDVDDRWNFQHKNYGGQNNRNCRTCHGADLKGTVLSRVAVDREVTCKGNGRAGSLDCVDDGTGAYKATITKGEPVTCGMCHKQKR